MAEEVRQILGFNSHIADAADDVVSRGLSLFDGLDFHRVCGVVRAQDQMIAGDLHVFECAYAILEDGVHIGFVFAVWLERVVVAVNEHGGAGQKAGVHAHAIASVGAENDKTLPVIPVSFHFRAKFAQKALLEFQNIFHLHAQNQRLYGDTALDQQDIFKIIFTGRSDACALVDFRGIDEVEYGKALDVEHFVHALDTQPAFTVEKIGNVGLLESGLLRELQAGKTAFINPLGERLAQVFLKVLEFHGGSIAFSYCTNYAKHLKEHLFLDEDYALDTEGNQA